MQNDHLLEDIRELNLAYLLLMQRLINTDREEAMFRLEMDAKMVDLLGRMPVAELSRLARCNQLLCRFSLDDHDQLQALTQAYSDDDMREMHAAILLNRIDRRAPTERRRAERRSGVDRRQRDDGPPDGVERRVGERRTGADRRRRDRRLADQSADQPDAC